MTRNVHLNTDAEVVALAQQLIERGWHVTAAESCTGGGVASAFTSIPGSSGWFEVGYVTYSNRIKHELLGVPTDVLERYGAVSEAVVSSMVEGALNHSKADIGVAISGIAGPDGGSKEKPVGTVWFAWAVRGRSPEASVCIFEGDRESVRRQAVVHAIKGLNAQLGKTPV